MVTPERYGAAFDVAVAVARERGMPPAFVDRRAGVIETEPAVVGSLLEPWRDADDPFPRTVEATLHLERRHVRFEFRPAHGGAAIPARPDVTGTTGPPVDLVTSGGPLELRAWAFVEQAHQPGLRRSAWSRRVSTRVVIPDEPSGPRWAPVTRDEALEARLLAEIARRLEAGGAESPG
jgi:hypothetical protein